MNLKGKIGMALATTALGATLVGGGTFALFTAQATNNNNTFAAGTVKINASSGQIFAGKQFISNLAPGDTETGTLTLTNSGTLDEWVGLEHTLSGDLFKNFTPSIDASAGSAYATDNNPLQISYVIQVKDAQNNPVGTPITRSAFSTSDNNFTTPFKLAVGQHADINYSYTLPLAAHNDYQGKTGTLSVEVDAVQVRNNIGQNGPQSWNPDING